MEIFLSPINVFLSLPLEMQLFGMKDGFLSNCVCTALKCDRVCRWHSDFGLGIILLKSGAILFFTTLTVYLLIIARAFIVVYKSRKNYSKELIPWLTLAFSGAIGMIGWLVSLSHYTIVTEVGGKQFLAFIIASTTVSLLRIKSIKDSNSKAEKVVMLP